MGFFNKQEDKQEEKQAEREYLSMIDTLQSSSEFENEWTGNWNNFYKESFGKKDVLVKGDKEKYMKYWVENQKIMNDLDWNKIQPDNYTEYDD